MNIIIFQICKKVHDYLLISNFSWHFICRGFYFFHHFSFKHGNISTLINAYKNYLLFFQMCLNTKISHDRSSCARWMTWLRSEWCRREDGFVLHRSHCRTARGASEREISVEALGCLSPPRAWPMSEPRRCLASAVAAVPSLGFRLHSSSSSKCPLQTKPTLKFEICSKICHPWSVSLKIKILSVLSQRPGWPKRHLQLVICYQKNTK